MPRAPRPSYPSCGRSHEDEAALVGQEARLNNTECKDGTDGGRLQQPQTAPRRPRRERLPPAVRLNPRTQAATSPSSRTLMARGISMSFLDCFGKRSLSAVSLALSLCPSLSPHVVFVVSHTLSYIQSAPGRRSGARTEYLSVRRREAASLSVLIRYGGEHVAAQA